MNEKSIVLRKPYRNRNVPVTKMLITYYAVEADKMVGRKTDVSDNAEYTRKENVPLQAVGNVAERKVKTYF